MQSSLIKHQGCIVEWSDKKYSMFNGACQHIQTFHFAPELNGLKCVEVPKLKFSRKRKPIRVYYVPGECKSEVLSNNFVGADHDYLEEFSKQKCSAEENNHQNDGADVVV